MTGADHDVEVVTAQLGRPARGFVGVVHACSLGLPVVVEVAPTLDSGEPFPTRYWLTCKLLHRRVARLEAAGGVRDAQAAVDADPELAARLDAAHRRYATERDAQLSEGAVRAPSGGVGGSRGGVKCLHAHLADGLAGNLNPIFDRVAPDVLPGECAMPCVIHTENTVALNPNWREPA